MTKSPNWNDSVERARLATIKTFEGRMEAAKASFEQIPPNGKSAEGKTLAVFADEAGIAYDSLIDYRRVWKWLGEDSVPVHGIGSYSLAKEAMNAGKWKMAKEFIAFMKADPTPTLRLDGYEPHTFPRWTRDALRIYLGQKPTATTKLLLKAVEIGEDATDEETKVAEVIDTFAEAAEEGKKIKGEKAGEVRDAVRDAYYEIIEEQFTPEEVPSRPMSLEYEIEAELRAILTHYKRIGDLCAEADRPGDDEDIIDLFDRAINAGEMTKEGYGSGKSLETFLANLLSN